MRKYAYLLTIMASLFAGCNDDSNDSHSEDGAPCTADACQNGAVQLKCVNGKTQAVLCGLDQICLGNSCVSSKTEDACTADVCLNSSVLRKCESGKYTNKACGDDEVCSGSSCKKGSKEDVCLDKCKDSSTMSICENGTYVDYPCGESRYCSEGVCIAKKPDVPDCVDECTDELSKTYHACVNGNHAAALSTCGDGKACVYGGCVDEFVEGDNCSEATGAGYCHAYGLHAVVCHDVNKKIWTCQAPCSVGDDGIVDCPKKTPAYEKQCEDNYKANCYNDNYNVHVCVKHQIVSWDCYGGTCSVDDKNEVYCPRNAGVAGLGGVTEGGTYDDMCNLKEYQEACIDKYFARICDLDGKVRIKPAGDCRQSSTNPKKVEYTVPAACDPDTQAAPFCINNGTAIGICTYAKGDDSVSYFTASMCPSCKSDEDAKKCMLPQGTK